MINSSNLDWQTNADEDLIVEGVRTDSMSGVTKFRMRYL
jgi:hypothetical protein